MENEAMTHTRPDEAGFTLVEALCAIVILVFGLIAITNLILVAATSNTVANHSTAATTLATQQMEALKATPFINLVPGGDLDSDADPNFTNVVAGAAPMVPGVGEVRVRWRVDALGCNQVLFLVVRGESLAPLAGTRSRAEFTALRTCTNVGLGCPVAAGCP
jgi:type II secretory pathway pseudopilin PulG